MGKVIGRSGSFLACDDLQHDDVDVSWSFNIPATCSMYLRDRSIETVVHAATLRQKSRVKLAMSPTHSILTSGQPVLALTL